MKRFYKTASVDKQPDGYGILLDRRPVRTPARVLLRVATERLAGALIEEWNAQGDEIDPLTMPLTQLTNTAIDRAPEHRAAMIGELVRYGETDLVCYRADHPQSLVDRQTASWQPLVDWLRQRYDIGLVTVTGVLPQPQNPAALSRLERIVASHDDFALTALHMAATSAGSVAIALALMEGRISLEQAIAAAQLDDVYQMEIWGTDEQAQARLTQGRGDLEAAWRFRDLSR